MSDFHKLIIKDIKQETEDSVVITIDPGTHREMKSFHAGQYISVEAEINGEHIRRSYSICSAPYENELSIGVKHIPSGRMSTYLNKAVKKGDEILIHAPEGKFCAHPDPELSRDHYFIAAGSGITPILSMMKVILESEPLSTCYLYYGNRKKSTIMFSDELEALQRKYEGQLFILHTLSRPELIKESGIKGWFGIKKPLWEGETGRIDLGKLINFFELYPSRAPRQEYYFCGPAELILLGENLLKERDVDEKHIHREFFTAPKQEGNVHEGAVDAMMEVNMNGKVFQVKLDKEKTILESLIEEGANPPYSCSSGACSSCIAKVKEGSVEMDVSYALDSDEIKDGFILTCQARPTSAFVSIVYDEIDELREA